VSQRRHWPLDDPAAAQGSEAERLAVFRRIRDEIGERVRGFLGAGSAPSAPSDS
jgi:arsenate reductase (thioredoxin)